MLTGSLYRDCPNLSGSLWANELSPPRLPPPPPRSNVQDLHTHLVCGLFVKLSEVLQVSGCEGQYLIDLPLDYVDHICSSVEERSQVETSVSSGAPVWCNLLLSG